MSIHKVLNVEGPKQWEGQYGVSYDWRLSLEGPNGVPLAHPAILTTKKPDNGPSVGQTLDLDVQPHPKLENTLKAKRIQDQQQGGGGRRQSDPAERASIEAQVALKCAVEYSGQVIADGRGAEVTAAKVAEIAGLFFQAIHRAASNA